MHFPMVDVEAAHHLLLGGRVFHEIDGDDLDGACSLAALAPGADVHSAPREGRGSAGAACRRPAGRSCRVLDGDGLAKEVRERHRHPLQDGVAAFDTLARDSVKFIAGSPADPPRASPAEASRSKGDCDRWELEGDGPKSKRSGREPEESCGVLALGEVGSPTRLVDAVAPLGSGCRASGMPSGGDPSSSLPNLEMESPESRSSTFSSEPTRATWPASWCPTWSSTSGSSLASSSTSTGRTRSRVPRTGVSHSPTPRPTTSGRHEARTLRFARGRPNVGLVGRCPARPQVSHRARTSTGSATRVCFSSVVCGTTVTSLPTSEPSWIRARRSRGIERWESKAGSTASSTSGGGGSR